MHQADLKASVAATPAMDQRSLYVRTDEAMLAVARSRHADRALLAEFGPQALNRDAMKKMRTE